MVFVKITHMLTLKELFSCVHACAHVCVGGAVCGTGMGHTARRIEEATAVSPTLFEAESPVVHHHVHQTGQSAHGLLGILLPRCPPCLVLRQQACCCAHTLLGSGDPNSGPPHT